MEQLQPSASLSSSPSGSGSRAFALIAIVSVAVVAVAGGAFLWLRAGSDMPNVPIPTLGLTPADAARPSLAARLIGSRGGVEVHYFDRNEARTGFTVTADRHILFTCPDTTVPGVRVSTAHGDPALFRTVRHWGYEYTMNELANERAGRRDRELFDGRFWLSEGELAHEYQESDGSIRTGQEKYGHLNTPGMAVSAGRLYYLMLDGATLGGRTFYVSCLDGDSDGLNNRSEDRNGNGSIDPGETKWNDSDTDDDALLDGEELTGQDIDLNGDRWTQLPVTNPLNRDTDGDMVQDGTELSRVAGLLNTNTAIFIPDADPLTATGSGRRTDPLNPDTDGGGIPDGAEDANRNGRVDAGETDPNNPADDAMQCSDGMDNADPEDTLADRGDPGCYSDGNAKTMTGTYVANDNDETNVPVCGNGAIDQASEECDDGNLARGDGCDDGCKITKQCNDRVDNADPEDIFPDGSDPGCYSSGNTTMTGTYIADDDDETHVPSCGNGIRDQAGEACDDGNTNDGDGCSRNCAVTKQCSDGADNADPEDTLADQADPGCYSNGNIVTGTYDPNDNNETHVPACGNGALEGGACDDGNAVNGDGCSSVCAVEEGWQCSGEPSACDLVIPSTECTTNDCRIERLLDANGDGTITPFEAALRHAALVEHIGSTLPEDIWLYDVNGDGVIAPDDSLLVGSYRNSHGL